MKPQRTQRHSWLTVVDTTLTDTVACLCFSQRQLHSDLIVHARDYLNSQTDFVNPYDQHLIVDSSNNQDSSQEALPCDTYTFRTDFYGLCTKV